MAPTLPCGPEGTEALAPLMVDSDGLEDTEVPAPPCGREGTEAPAPLCVVVDGLEDTDVPAPPSTVPKGAEEEEEEPLGLARTLGVRLVIPAALISAGFGQSGGGLFGFGGLVLAAAVLGD